MKNRTIIHVGLAKTGTTFLQTEIFPKLHINYSRNILLTDIDIKPGINLLSNESLSISIPHYVPRHTDRMKILEYIKRLFPDGEIMIGMRQLNDSLKNSYYSQYLRNGGTLKKDAYLKKYEEYFTNYIHYLRAIEKKFDNVFSYTFEEFKDNQKQTIKNICDFLGQPVPKYNLKIVHSSYPPRQQETKRKLNYLCKSMFRKKGIPIGILNKTLEDIRDG